MSKGNFFFKLNCSCLPSLLPSAPKEQFTISARHFISLFFFFILWFPLITSTATSFYFLSSFLATHHRVFAKTSQSKFHGRSPSQYDWSAALPWSLHQIRDHRMFPSASLEIVACSQFLAHSPPACSNLKGSNQLLKFIYIK